jgi:xanthine dehydrogenase accessory factor
VEVSPLAPRPALELRGRPVERARTRNERETPGAAGDRVSSTGVREVVEALLEVLAGRERGALATVVKTSGSTPQKPGARLLLRPDGRVVGTVGGGAIEQAVLDALQATRADGAARTVERDLGFDLGMCCGGRMEVFVEPIESTPRLLLVGAGHVAKPTAALARTVGFDVTVVDDRDDMNNADRFPGCALAIEDPASYLGRARLGEIDWVIILSHDHALDERALALVMRHSPRYVGLVGSKRKVFRLVQRVAAKGGPVALDRLYAPVGLDLGGVTPEELAVSIVGELIAIRHGKEVTHLRAMDDPRLARTLAGAEEP